MEITVLKASSFRLGTTALLLGFVLGIAIHVSEATDAVESSDLAIEGFRPGNTEIQRGSGLMDNRLSGKEKENNRRACLLDLQAEYRRIVGKHLRGKNAVLVDMVEHWNLGDSFIQYGEQLLMQAMGTPIAEVCSVSHCNWTSVDLRLREDSRPSMLLIHGGGNFGDVWPSERKHHHEIIKKHPRVPILWLPQTVYYKDLKLASVDAEAFSSNPNMHMFARDVRSLSVLQTYFTNFPSELCPDAAFNIGPINAQKCRPRFDVLVLARKDKESFKPFGDVGLAGTFLEENNRTYSVVDWPCGQSKGLPKDRLDHARHRFDMGKKCLCQGRIIVTDRLHAVILATLMGLPHVFLDNNYGKIHGYRQAHFKPRPACTDASLNAHKASSWHLAMKVANHMLTKL